MLGDRYYKTARTEDMLGRQALLTDIMRLQMVIGNASVHCPEKGRVGLCASRGPRDLALETGKVI